ncbi:MAG: hypothetical protein ACE5NM_11150 [Sedimentisphaerales bacterium]
MVSAFFISVVSVTLGLSAGTTGKPLLPDGFVLRGVEGKLVRQDSNNGWFFEFEPAVNDSKGRVSAGARLELLPSSALEQMAADANDRSLAPAPVAGAASATGAEANYRLWARLTKYKGRNFIFPIYFLPLRKAKQLQSLPSPQNQEKPKLLVEPNDELAIPEKILDKLKARRTILRQQPERRIKVRQNFILANRTGFISSCVMRDAYRAEKNTQYDIRNTRYVFVFDALGRNIQQTTVRLLPCQALELAEQRQSAEPDPIRFKIAGIVTEYKGERFLLLQRATRVYSYGNFGR